jgi:hypothetical protein
MKLTDRIRKRALALGTRAFTALMADEKRAERVMNTLGAAQRGKVAARKAQNEILHTLGFASKHDYTKLARAADSLAEQLRELEKQLDGLN